MLQKSITLCMLAGVMLLCSCGAGKKLAVVQEEAEALRNKTIQLEKQVASVTEQNKAAAAAMTRGKEEFDAYKAECAKTQEKLRTAQGILQEEYNTLQEIENKIETALADFEGKGMDVYYKDGLVYVSMADELLYKSGSSALGENGKQALSGLASVLNDYPKMNVVVLGNTDDVQFKKGTDNWSLSTERANGVVRVLRDQYKVDPARLTAAGKGKYKPVADNATAEGRAKNRRTEIILNPSPLKLWDSIQQ